MILFRFFPNLILRLFRGHDAVKLMERVHVERKIVDFTLVIGYGRIDEIVELAELRYEIPDFFIGCV